MSDENSAPSGAGSATRGLADRLRGSTAPASTPSPALSSGAFTLSSSASRRRSIPALQMTAPASPNGEAEDAVPRLSKPEHRRSFGDRFSLSSHLSDRRWSLPTASPLAASRSVPQPSQGLFSGPRPSWMTGNTTLIGTPDPAASSDEKLPSSKTSFRGDGDGEALGVSALAAGRQRKRRRRKIIIVVVGLVALAAVGGVVGGVLGSRTAASDTGNGPTGTESGDGLGGQTINAGNSTNGTSANSTSANSANVARGYSTLAVFGASYCDNAHPRSSTFGYSITSSPYWNGRWSNGPVWAEYLSAAIGPVSNGVQSNATLLDYAFAGAVVSNALTYVGVPDLATQVGLFTGQLNGTYANATVAATATNGRTLVAVWMGLNSLSYAVDQLNAGSQTYSWAQQAILSSANAVSTDMLQIARSSAYKSAQAPPDFLVMPIPPAQTIPTFVERSGYGGISLAQIANLTSSYNAAVLNGALTLAQALAKDGRGARVFTFDIPGLWTNYTSSPSKYGLSDVRDACTTGKSGASVCANPASHLYWDSTHPTTTIHRAIANRLRTLLYAL